MEFRVLEYYLMVAREENITRAAELLHITQPTLSRQLMQLEEELGVKLFRRGKHNIALTEEGLLLKRRAQEMVDMADKTRRELRQEDESLSGVISIGSGETKSMRFLADCIAGFHRQHPKVTFDIFSSTADYIKERIEKGLLDLGFLMEPVDVGKYQFIRLPQKARWGVLVRRDSALAQKERVEAADLLETPLITAKRDTVQNELANWFGEYYERLSIVATYNLLNNAAVMADSLNGAVLCHENNIAYQNLTFVPLEPRLEAGSVLVWKKGQYASSLMNSFTAYLKQAEKALREKEEI